MRIYVASSWRNYLQPAVVQILRSLGHDVYDFRHPAADDNGFHWSQIDRAWRDWTPEQYRAALDHPIARKGYANDMAALRGCDACVLVLPCGRSAHWELGYAMGAGKRGSVVMLAKEEPELMYREAEIIVSVEELVAAYNLHTEAA